MRLSHWSTEPLAEVYSVDPVTGRGDKPRGLWVSVDGEDDWKAWCEAEEWGDLPSKIRHEVALASDAHLLHLETHAQLIEFGREHAAETFPGERDRNWLWSIDWAKVAASWRGIIIAPYQWPARFDAGTEWYYSWDCASGCIWDADAVAEIRTWVAAEVVTEAAT